MLKVVNYVIENKKLKIKQYQEDGKDFVFYDKNSVAVLDTNLDLKEEMTLIELENERLPIILPKKAVEQIKKQENKPKTKEGEK